MYRQSLDVETQAVPSNNAFAAQGDSASLLEFPSSGPQYDVPTRAPLPSTISKDSTRLDSRVAHHPLAVSTPLLSANACLRSTQQFPRIKRRAKTRNCPSCLVDTEPGDKTRPHSSARICLGDRPTILTCRTRRKPALQYKIKQIQRSPGSREPPKSP